MIFCIVFKTLHHLLHSRYDHNASFLENLFTHYFFCQFIFYKHKYSFIFDYHFNTQYRCLYLFLSLLQTVSEFDYTFAHKKFYANYILEFYRNKSSFSPNITKKYYQFSFIHVKITYIYVQGKVFVYFFIYCFRILIHL